MPDSCHALSCGEREAGFLLCQFCRAQPQALIARVVFGGGAGCAGMKTGDKCGMNLESQPGLRIEDIREDNARLE